jgi:hypothetical protein
LLLLLRLLLLLLLQQRLQRPQRCHVDLHGRKIRLRVGAGAARTPNLRRGAHDRTDRRSADAGTHTVLLLLLLLLLLMTEPTETPACAAGS